jgi:hypothetical protein
MDEPRDAVGSRAALWVLAVIVIGLVVGLALALLVPVPAGPGAPPRQPGSPPPPPGAQPFAQAMVVLSSVSIAELLALLVVYGRTYRTTQAPYMLGLFVFLLALLMETLLTSPFLLIAFGTGPGSLGRFLALGQLLMAVALGIFLYLSVQ